MSPRDKMSSSLVSESSSSGLINSTASSSDDRDSATGLGCGQQRKIRCTLVGDGGVGKTTLIVSYTTNGFPTEYEPTAFDTYSVQVMVDESPIKFELCDTAGQADFDRLLPFCYPETDVFMLCFSVVSPTSFYNLSHKWVRDIQHYAPKAPVFLVGTQSDLRDDVNVLINLDRFRQRPIPRQTAEKLSHSIGALAYIECSSLTQKNMKDVFDLAILSGLEYSNKRKRGDVKKSSRRNKRKVRYMDSTTKSRHGWRSVFCLS